MKGITHFAVGLAAASCVPAAVDAGAAGNPVYFILGGVFGLLPDTLDFKLYRFCYRSDVVIRPDPNAFDAQVIVDGVASAVNRAYISGRSVRLKLDTVQLDEDRWQSYRLLFDVAGRQVEAAEGPVVDMGGNREVVGGRDGCAGSRAKADLIAGIKLDYFADIDVDILDGPVIELMPVGDKVVLSFLPWHRSWTHSFIVGTVFGLICWVIWGVAAGVVVLSSYSLHIMLDQLGFMGSNLWFPFSKQRKTGAMKVHSGDAAWNFATVWLACLLIFWNLYVGSEQAANGLTAIKLLFYGAVIPAAVWKLKCRIMSVYRSRP